MTKDLAWSRAFASVLVERLEEEGITARQLAVFVGVSDPTVSLWINAKTCPSVYHFAELCEALTSTPSGFLRAVSSRIVR